MMIRSIGKGKRQEADRIFGAVLIAVITAIEEEAFMGDLSLESVIIPDGCASIGPRAFAGCANLMYARVPAATAIAEDAFEGCDQVTLDIVE